MSKTPWRTFKNAPDPEVLLGMLKSRLEDDLALVRSIRADAQAYQAGEPPPPERVAKIMATCDSNERQIVEMQARVDAWLRR